MSLSETIPRPLDPAPILADSSGSPVSDYTDTPAEPAVIYGSFWVSGSEFALPVGAIREIVVEPDAITSVPLSPSFLKGLFNVRGMTIPIVDLRCIFDLNDGDGPLNTADKRKVAIVEHGDKCVGILFDKAGEVLKKPIRADVDLRQQAGGHKGNIIEGVLSLDDGNRMVQTIDPEQLLDLENVPHAKIADFRSTRTENLGPRRSCVSFQLGHTVCAIDLRYVHEVREVPPIDPTWLVYGPYIGTVTLRGVLVPVVDFRSYMGSEPAFLMTDDLLTERKLLVIKTTGGLIALMVFSVDSIIPFFENDVLPFAKLALPRSELVQGSLISENEEVVVLLDHDNLLSDPGLAETAQNVRDMQTSAKAAAKKDSVSAVRDRKTFILFSLDGCFAMDTSHVIEVIDKPEDFLEPSYALDIVEGIINLRGDLITLFNLRKVYGLDQNNTEQQKILIFKLGDQKYSILVDSVDEIVMTTSDKVLPSYEVDGSTTASPASGEVSHVLNFSRPGRNGKLAMIMDAAALIARCERMTQEFEKQI